MTYNLTALADLPKMPSRIYEIQTALAALDLDIVHLKTEATAIESIVDKDVAFDPSLRNEKQRDVRRFELLGENLRYQEVQQNLRDLGFRRSLKLAELRFAQNELTVGKVLAQLTIASNIHAPSLAGRDPLEDAFNEDAIAEAILDEMTYQSEIG